MVIALPFMPEALRRVLLVPMGRLALGRCLRGAPGAGG
jgi:hypothetical protein